MRELIRYLKCLFLILVMASFQTMAQEGPWHLSADGADVAPASIASFNIKPGPHVINIAVIDSGVLIEHPSLSGRVLPGYDMVSGSNNLRGERSGNFAPDERNVMCKGRAMSSAFHTHGTEVSSLIVGNGEYGVYGVNANAKIVPIKVFSACGIKRKDLMDAMIWAAGWPVSGVPINANPAKIINLSLSGGLSTCGDDLQNLINKLIEQGVFVVAAAGNNFHKTLQEPANCKGVISVGAIDADNRIEVYSALDPRISIYAPGGGKRLNGKQSWSINKLKIATYEQDLLGKEGSTGEVRGVGTSFAAPIVSGFISLWLSYDPSKKPADLAVELPKFSRAVNLSSDCEQCQPMRLNASFLSHHEILK
jgi:serine protease